MRILDGRQRKICYDTEKMDIEVISTFLITIDWNELKL